MSARLAPDSRADYAVHLDIPTRWNDNDTYGHVNNAVYYEYFDTCVNHWLIGAGLLELGRSAVIGLVVDTGCSYFAPLSFPEVVTAGLRVVRVGTSSVRYEIGLFSEGAEVCAARGHFTHVYVDEATRRPVALADRFRAAVEGLRIDAPS